MTINGPAPMLLGFFMNAAIDQCCEKYIKENGLTDEVEAKIKAIYRDLGCPRPTYQGELPEGNDGLGLLLLGVSGDQVLPQDVYAKIKADAIRQVRGTVQADILYQFRVTTSPKPVPIRSLSWPLRCRTVLPSSSTTFRAA